MTMKESIKKYYLDENMNCAESVLHAADEAWKLELMPETFKAVAPFGGMCCGQTCGAIAGAVAAIGTKYVDDGLHKSPLAKEKTEKFMKEFHRRFGSYLCQELKCRYAKDERRCLELVEQVAELLEEMA
jgi:C_GCAxxG_C_C family probable redox protein